MQISDKTKADLFLVAIKMINGVGRKTPRKKDWRINSTATNILDLWYSLQPGMQSKTPLSRREK